MKAETIRLWNMVRELVDREGWAAVHAHPELGPFVAQARAEQRAYVDAVIDCDHDYRR